MPGVSIRKMQKSYGGVVGVGGIDLDIAEGELVVLLGPSGCGKTTTLRCVAGLEEVTGGEIHIGDTVVSTADSSVPPEKREIGMVFQSYAIWPHMTVSQNVAFGLKVKRLADAEVKRRAGKALETVGLSHLADRPASQLSGGQQQRVALARAIVLEPKILLFDEPLSNLDARLREQMRVEVRRLQKRLGITSLYVTHDQQEAMAIADRIVLMRNGAIEQIGSAQDLYSRPETLFVAEFVGTANVLTGTVVSEGGRLFVKVANSGHAIECAPGPNAVPGAVVDLVVRPEHLVLSQEQGGDAHSSRVTVVDWVFLGSLAEVDLKLGEHALRAQVSPPSIRFSPGQELWLTADPENVVVLPHSASAQEDRLYAA